MTTVDVIAYENAVDRTYAVPQEVAAIVASVFQNTFADDTPARDFDVALKLATYGRVTAEDALYICSRDIKSLTATGDSRGKLLGGESGHDWASKIVAGVTKDIERERDARLANIAFDDRAFHYLGLADSSSPNRIEYIVRVPVGSADFNDTNVLTASGDWVDDILHDLGLNKRIGIALDRDLLAFTASAFTDGYTSVILQDAIPLCFLPEMPLLAAVSPGDVTGNANDPNAHVYAVVDATDTTAVLSVIKIVPGPQVYSRNGGAWTLDQATLDSLMSVNPPPIVELTGGTLKSVLEQTDTSQAQQVVPSQDGSADTGAKLDAAPIKQKPITPGSTEQSKSPAVTASVRVIYAYRTALDTAHAMESRDRVVASARWATDEAYTEGYSLDDAWNSARSVAQRRSYEIRHSSMRSAATLLASLRAIERTLSNVLLPAATYAIERDFIESLTADGSATNSAKGHLEGTERLRRYWIAGAGSAKIRWGEPNDFYRCRDNLAKYLPTKEVDGYCARLHHYALGVWPGQEDKTS